MSEGPGLTRHKERGRQNALIAPPPYERSPRIPFTRPHFRRATSYTPFLATQRTQRAILRATRHGPSAESNELGQG
jgi:hypothetical protein